MHTTRHITDAKLHGVSFWPVAVIAYLSIMLGLALLFGGWVLLAAVLLPGAVSLVVAESETGRQAGVRR